MNDVRLSSKGSGSGRNPGRNPGISVHRETLSNGLRLLLLERPGLPLLSYHLLVETGTVAERSAAESGLAQFTTQLLSQGTRNRSAVELAEAIENLGASLGARSDRDFTTVGLSSLARDRFSALQLLAEVVRQPAFDSAEVERKRQELLTSLHRKEDDPGYLVSRLLARRLFGEHPYHRSVLGESKAIESLMRDDVVRFYDTQFVPDRSVLAIVGEFDRSQVLTEVESEFGAWAPSESLQGPRADSQSDDAFGAEPPTPISTGKREVHQKDGVKQATVRVGGLAIPRRHPDYVPLVVLNHILGGGGFSSRLMKSLRDEKGWTYGASSGLQLHKVAGAWIAGFKTSHETLEPAVELLLDEIDRLGRGGPTDDEVEQARAFLTGSLPLSFETNAQWASHALEGELYGLPEFFWETETEQLRDLRGPDLAEVAGRYLRRDAFAIAVHGDFRAVPSTLAD